MRLRLVPVLLGLALFLTAPLSQQAQAAIRVIVNDMPITDYDISQRARLITLTQRKSASVAKRQAQEELVDDHVKLAEAERMGIDISQSQVDSAYGNIARNVKMSPGQLSKALGQGGVKPETLKYRLKAQLAWNQIVQARFRGKIEVDESDIIAALKKTDEEDRQKSIEYDLKRVIVVVPKSSSGGFKSKRKRESDQIRAAFNDCENPGAVLGKYSEVVVQPIGRRLETELPENMRKEIAALQPGKLTKASTTPVGYEMIAVCGKREIASDIAVRTELENELRAKEGESQSRRYLLEIRRRATIIYR
ncbi:SurA N-terminal domain-containing protein [Roseibium sediminicola]|uniref:SurA N-terminal domain-containing protein n=1 Tax=Roseibium sediminicola TaxID=2933272 RepID=A0ABT0GXN0_9HYPH|nr:SurA N-terminal domain-containing protein [Roseibium sp. CAU 1639]MCK7614199.1 SurA N-terminal domain-containing protein [Roseibium sp. CAU 1639]